MKDFQTANQKIVEAIAALQTDNSKDALVRIVYEITEQCKTEGRFLVPIELPKGEEANLKRGQILYPKENMNIKIRFLKDDAGVQWLTAFTDEEQLKKGPKTTSVSYDMLSFFKMSEKMPGIGGVLINPWTQGFRFPENIIQVMINSIQPENHIYINKGDITDIECDCYVNAANKTLLGGGGVDGAIHKKAGSELLEECKTLGGCETGEAKITKGYNLKAKNVIHTVGPIYSGSERDKEALFMCYWNSLELAKQNNIHSIAFPSISTGAYGYPLEEAARIAIGSVSKWLHDNEEYGMAVIFSCFDDNTYELYHEMMYSPHE